MGAGLSMASVNKIKELANQKEYSLAVEIIDSQDLSKSLNPQFLRMCGQIYTYANRYADARRVLLMSHKLAMEGKRAIYSLVYLYLKMGYRKLAKTYYDIYMFDADPTLDETKQLEYLYLKSEMCDDYARLEDLIAIDFANHMDYDWSFETFLLYKIQGKDKEAENLYNEYIATFKNEKSSDAMKKLNELEDVEEIKRLFYCFTEEENEDDDENQEQLRKEEATLLQQDELRMHPKDPEIMIMVDDEDEEINFGAKRKYKKFLKEQNKQNKAENGEGDADSEGDSESDTSESDSEKKEKKSLRGLFKKKSQDSADESTDGADDITEPEETKAEEQLEESKSDEAEKTTVATEIDEAKEDELEEADEVEEDEEDELEEVDEDEEDELEEVDEDELEEIDEVEEDNFEEASSEEMTYEEAKKFVLKSMDISGISDDDSEVDEFDDFTDEFDEEFGVMGEHENEEALQPSKMDSLEVELKDFDESKYEVDDFSEEIDSEFGVMGEETQEDNSEAEVVITEVEETELEAPEEIEEEIIEEVIEEETVEEAQEIKESIEEAQEIEEIEEVEEVDEIVEAAEEVEETYEVDEKVDEELDGESSEEVIEEETVEEIEEVDEVVEAAEEVEETYEAYDETIETSETSEEPASTIESYSVVDGHREYDNIKKNNMDFPVFKSSLFPTYHEPVKTVENHFDDIMSSAWNKMSTNNEKEAMMMKEAEALLASLGIDLGTVKPTITSHVKSAEKKNNNVPSRDELKASLKIDSTKKTIIRKLKEKR